ncbi:MAG: gamma-glutamyl-gamma-aminobutyrate hydrolase family protein, partial [Pseudomonadales bacterium]|nr:gamma-glutamyl-gamma-aminobutyrate hydrolase family protein [Pseudomonadales bacterium]
MSLDIHAQRILILDFGSQYTQLIARRIREAGVYCEIHPWDMSEAEITAFNPRGIVLSGGPETVTQQDTPRAPAAVYDMGLPLLGICYGMQTMAQQLGGKVEASDVHEFGYAEVAISGDAKLLQGIVDKEHDGQQLLDV